MKVEVGNIYKQIKAIDEYGFNYVGRKFVITLVNDSIFMGRSGNLNFGIDKEKLLDYFEPVVKEETPKSQSIHIYSDGKKITTAILKQDGKIIKKTEARLDNIDTFDFNTGATIAFDRLVGREVKIEDKKVEVKKEEFKPYLDLDGEIVGYIGDKTGEKDFVGQKLYIGDIVEVFSEGQSYGENSVCFENRMRVMGVWEEKFINGKSNNWYIIKKRSFKEVKEGEKIYYIKYIKTKR